MAMATVTVTPPSMLANHGGFLYDSGMTDEKTESSPGRQARKTAHQARLIRLIIGWRSSLDHVRIAVRDAIPPTTVTIKRGAHA